MGGETREAKTSLPKDADLSWWFGNPDCVKNQPEGSYFVREVIEWNLPFSIQREISIVSNVFRILPKEPHQ